ncbi:CD82 antigen [Cylas formicarius]|uniref:CD82 antigen n=1 Tax=Cylas formicarius TaxID=197179 RepID=UPI002958BE9B|nr:CD82 antigen [Cylas formicarius]
MSCYSFIKYLFIFLNVIFLIIGLTGIGVITWMLVDPTIPLHFTQDPSDFMIAVAVYMVVAIVLVIISILGIQSVLKEIRWALVLSFSLLLIIVVVEVASGVWIYMNQEDLDKFTRASVKNSVKEYSEKDENVQNMFDAIQSKFKCCGADGPADWARIKEINMGITANPTQYNIPSSCCRPEKTEQECFSASKNFKFGKELDYKIIFEKGCYNLIKENIINSLSIIIAVFGTILAIKLLGLIIGLILAFSMKRSNRYKA